MVYYIVFTLLALGTLNQHKINTNSKLTFGIIAIEIFFIFFIGLRDATGGDWYNYLDKYYTSLPYMDIYDTIKHDDPGFWFISWIMYNTGLNIYGTNTFVAIIFIIGLYRLLKFQPYPWLGLMVAFPYLIIVVSMGYVRQAAAIGFIMWGFSYLKEDKFLKFILFVFFAVIFHKTAVIMVGIAIFAGNNKNKFFKLLAVVTIGVGLYFSFLSQYQEKLIHGYIDANMQSSGAFIRVVMNVVPAVILIKYRKIWKQIFDDYKLWFIIALSSILALFLVKFASTVIDRLSLYFIPIQIVVFSRLPILINKNRLIIKLYIILYYFLVLFGWLNFANFSSWWQPYQNIIFNGLF